jgi:hypothetical protein
MPNTTRGSSYDSARRAAPFARQGFANMSCPIRRTGRLLLLIAVACSGEKSTDTPNGSAGAGTTGGSHGSSGGSTSSGGTKSTGGVIFATGGVAGSGGSPGTGGSAAGGSNSGGVTPTGGAKPTGGSSAGAGTSPAAGAGGAAAGTPGSSGSSGNATGGGAGTNHTGVWNVMPLGDSITAATCYPQVLAQKLKAGGHTNFQFVGSQTTNQSCGSDAPSVKSEGHGGYGVTYLPMNSKRSACTKSTGCGSYGELQSWAMQKPDMVIMHYGTNDVWDGQPTADILAAYLAVIAEFRKQKPDVVFFVSKIIKLDPSGCASCLASVQALAAALTDEWAITNSAPMSPVHVVDAHDSGFDPSNGADAADGVHPTLAGATKMATAIYDGVVAEGYF